MSDKFDLVRILTIPPNGGILKSKEIPYAEFKNARHNGTNIDINCIVRGMGDFSEKRSDALIVPDDKIIPTPLLDTERTRTGIAMSRILDHNGEGSPYCVRSILAKTAAKLPYEVMIGAELEFNLLKGKPDGKITKDDFLDNSDYADFDPMTPGGKFRVALFEMARDMGIEIEALHSENYGALHEAILKYKSAMDTADNVVILSEFVRMLATKHGHHAVFDPKILGKGHFGSGLHMHLSCADKKDGRNLFYDDGVKLSRFADDFTAGAVHRARELGFFMGPDVIKSYERISDAGFEAPASTAVNSGDRSAWVRVPNGANRVEFRGPDPSLATREFCHYPHLTMTALINAGHEGVTNKGIFDADVPKLAKTPIGTYSAMKSSHDEKDGGDVLGIPHEYMGHLLKARYNAMCDKDIY
ncbi:MAG: glutamine synthetase [Firmicutes bacterium]|nr:glutamine synthetase [Bacillota bacterium]